MAAMSADGRDQWRDRLVESVDRTLERVYLTDPMLYAELVRLRYRLRPKTETREAQVADGSR